MAAHTTTEIAAALDLDHVGPAVDVSRVDALDRASATDLTFSVYDDADPIGESDAGAVICPPAVARAGDETLLYAENPKLSTSQSRLVRTSAC